MSNRLVLFVMFYAVLLTSQAQNPNTLSTSPLTSYGTGVNMRINDLPPPPPELDNSLYLTEDWISGGVLFYDGRVIKECTHRYDIANGYIEIKGINGIRAAEEINIEQFTVKEDSLVRWFVNASKFESDKKEKTNLMEVLVDGKVKLLLSSKVEIINNGGGFTDQRRQVGGDPITSRKITKMYLVKDNKLIDVNSKGKFLKALADKEDEVKAYAKKNDYGFTKEGEMTKIVTYYLELLDI